jgi:hypothetical protein
MDVAALHHASQKMRKAVNRGNDSLTEGWGGGRILGGLPGRPSRATEASRGAIR